MDGLNDKRLTFVQTSQMRLTTRLRNDNKAATVTRSASTDWIYLCNNYLYRRLVVGPTRNILRTLRLVLLGISRCAAIDKSFLAEDFRRAIYELRRSKDEKQLLSHSSSHVLSELLRALLIFLTFTSRTLAHPIRYLRLLLEYLMNDFLEMSTEIR